MNKREKGAHLHVARLSGLDGRVDQALSAGHSVEEKLCGRQAGVEAVGHEALGGRQLGGEGRRVSASDGAHRRAHAT